MLYLPCILYYFTFNAVLVLYYNTYLFVTIYFADVTDATETIKNCNNELHRKADYRSDGTIVCSDCLTG